MLAETNPKCQVRAFRFQLKATKPTSVKNKEAQSGLSSQTLLAWLNLL